MARRAPWWLLSLLGWLAWAAGTAGLLLALSGCWAAPRPPAEHTPPPPAVAAPPAADATAGEADDLAAARRALAQAQADLAAAAARVAGLEQAQDQARREGHRRLLAWASGLAILGALACGALAIFLPVLRGRLALVAAACGVVLILAQTLAVALPWLPLVGAALALLALLGLALALWLRLRAAVTTAYLLADRDDPAWSNIRARLIAAQGGEGSPIQADLDRLAKAEQARHQGAA